MSPRHVRTLMMTLHARRHDDAYVQDYLRMLRSDNRKLRAELESITPIGFSASGRRAFGRLLSALLLGLALATGAAWWRYSDSAEQARRVLTGGASPTSTSPTTP